MTTAVPAATPSSLARRAVTPTLAIAVLGALVYGGIELHGFEQRPLTLEGVPVGRGDPEPLVRELARDWYETEVTLDAGSRVVRATRRELGGEIDVERSVSELRAARGHAPIWMRVWSFAIRRPGAFRWHRDLDDAATRAYAEELRRTTVVEASAVRRDGSGGRPGMTLNLIGATAAIGGALDRDTVFLRLPVSRVEPHAQPIHDPRIARYTEVVAAHETHYSRGGDDPGRAINIEVAAGYLDGTIIRSGEVLSFNEVVGERSTVRGFMPAIELGGGGRRVEGTGGGVCQVAATLFAAAFFAGFEVVEHHPHTRNSSYIEAGLDAAVSWPNHDVRVRNPHNFPVRVAASTERGRLRVALMGVERGPRVEWHTEIVQRIPRGVEREVVRSLPLGSVEVVDEGEDGSIMERIRTVYWTDGELTDTATLNYPVVNQLVRVGPTSVGQ